MDTYIEVERFRSRGGEASARVLGETREFEHDEVNLIGHGPIYVGENRYYNERPIFCDKFDCKLWIMKLTDLVI